MRRMFKLPEEDEDFLNEILRLPWETVQEKGVNRLIIHEYPIPAGYNHSKVSLNLRLEGGYPGSQIDMVYFFPALALLDGRPIPALANDPLDGKVWQRWSRHRTAENPWVAGIDSVQSHLILVDGWLEKEVQKGMVR